jgi:hypothetical protein
MAPKRIQLVFPRGGLGLAGGRPQGADYESKNGTDEVMCVMTQCDVTYEAFFPSGLPRIATVALAFAQIAQLPGTGPVAFPDATDMGRVKTRGNKEVSLGYNIQVKLK